jgi:RNA polymerase sigma factor (sigma-70 family)
LVDRWGGPLLAYLARTLGLPNDDAADVLNEVLYKAILRIEQLRDPGRLEAWLYRMAYGAGVDWHRRRKRRREVATEPARIEAHAEPVDPWADEEDTQSSAEPAMHEALAALSPRDREVLSAVAHDLTNDEIAGMLSVTPAHARVLRHRAVERLRREYVRAAGRGEIADAGTNLREGSAG